MVGSALTKPHQQTERLKIMYTYYYSDEKGMEYCVKYDIMPEQKATYDQPYCPPDVAIISITNFEGEEVELSDDALKGLCSDIIEQHDFEDEGDE